MADTYTIQLEALEDERDAAKFSVGEAREAVRSARSDLAREVTADLAEFHAANEFKRPDATPPEQRAEREVELSAATLDAVRDAGLTIRPIATNGRIALLIHDPHVDGALEAAVAEAARLDREVAAFCKAHAADLERERQEAEADAYREALAANNLEAARRIFNRESGNGVFTTDDLARPTVHRRSPVLGR
jgi:hypothetical protein